MTVSTVISIIDLPGNGVDTSFDFPFEIPYQDDGVTPAVIVTTTTSGVTVTVAANAYTVTGVGNPSGGTILYNPGTPIAVGTTLTITRAKDLTQPSAFPNNSLLPENIEHALDLVVLEMQQLRVPQIIPVPTTIPNIPVPTNNWPDPQFCLQDANRLLAAANNETTGSIGPVAITGYTTGSSTVVCSCADTTDLLENDLIYFDVPADPVLSDNGQTFRITAIVPNVSFTVLAEVYWGTPSVSAACMVHVTMRGVSGAGSGNVTSNCQRVPIDSTGPTVWISDHAVHTAGFKGCKRVLVVLLGSAPAKIYFNPGVAAMALYGGQHRAVGMAVKVMGGAGAAAQAFINNGAVVPGGVIATTSDRTWCSTNAVASAVTYQAGIELSGAAGSSFILGEFTECAYPGVLPDGAFSTPRAQTVIALASVSPWVGVEITVPGGDLFTVDLRQVSFGQISEGISYVMGLLEGQAATAGFYLGSYNQSAPSIFNPRLHQPLAGADSDPKFYAFSSGDFNLDANARLIFNGVATQNWKHLSWDLFGVVNFASP